MSSADLTILDVGHGNSALIWEPSQVTLIDVAPGRTVSEAIGQAGIKVIDTVVVSHADADHCGGLVGLLLDESLVIRHVVFNADPRESGTWEDILRALMDARKRGNTRVRIDLTTDYGIVGDHREFKIEVLSPSPILAARGPQARDLDGNRLTANSLSAVLRVWRRGVPIVLFAGDLDGIGLRHLLLEVKGIRAKILVFPHHGGSAGALGDAREFAATLCRAVQPEIVVFSIARGRFGTPRPTIMDGIRDAVPSAYIFCTQLSERCAGTIPSIKAGHLSERVAHGSYRRVCCGGSLVLDMEGLELVRSPAKDAHSDFVTLHAPKALCRPDRRRS